MALSEQEAVASFRVLVGVAKADGVLHEEERRALEAGLKGIRLPKGAALKSLLDEDANLDAQVRQLVSEEARTQTYQAAFALAYADGECSMDEQKLMEKLQAGLKIPEEKVSWTRRIVGEARDTFLPSHIQPIADPRKRAAEIREDILKYSTLSALLGLNPVPVVSIATELAAVGVQVKMIRDLGQYYGHRVDQAAAKALMAGVGAGTGARVAVNSLLKFFPGVGSVVAAGTNFATTYAIGQIAGKWFESSMKADPEELRKAFRAAEKEGKTQYKERKVQIETRRKAKETHLMTLAEELRIGEMGQEEYEKKVAELA
jgi:uncharacterized protein (DUF697 family)/uncharacterized tellurite resistance protein B-like protein